MSKKFLVSDIKPHNKHYYFSFQYENNRFANLFLGKDEEYLISPEFKKEMEDFIVDLNKIDTNVEVFKNCMNNDILVFHKIIQDFIKNRSKKISKADALSYLNFYASLIGMKLIPTSEMTKNIGVALKSDPVTGEIGVEISSEFRRNPGKAINKILVSLNDFFQSWKNGLFYSLAKERVEDKSMDEVIFSMDLLLYSVMIYVIEYKADDLISKSSEEKAKGYYKHLLDEEGNFLEREIETGEEDDEKSKETPETISPDKNEVPDLSGSSTENKDRRGETKEEFVKNNSSEEDAPTLIKVKK